MKRLAYIAALAIAASAGYVGHEHDALPRLLPEREQPKATAITVRGPTEAVAGTDSFFVATATGDHGRPTWIVSPECDLSVSDDGTVARMKCNEPGAYTVTVTVGGKDATVAADLRHLTVVDLDQEIETAVAAVQSQTEPPKPSIGQLALASEHLPDPSEWPKAVGVLKLRADMCANGLLPSDSNPIRLAAGDAGPSWVGFFDDLDRLVNELRLAGEVTTAPSYEPVLRDVAAALSR